MERTGAEKGAKRKGKEEGEGGAAGVKEEERDTALAKSFRPSCKQSKRWRSLAPITVCQI